MLAATKVKTSVSEKETNRNTYDISSIKLITRTFHVFWLIRPRRRRRLALHGFIFCLSKLLVY